MSASSSGSLDGIGGIDGVEGVDGVDGLDAVRSADALDGGRSESSWTDRRRRRGPVLSAGSSRSRFDGFKQSDAVNVEDAEVPEDAEGPRSVLDEVEDEEDDDFRLELIGSFKPMAPLLMLLDDADCVDSVGSEPLG